MSWIYVERHHGDSRIRLFGGCLVFSGEILMTSQGFLQIALYVVTLLASGEAGGQLYGEGLSR